MVKKVTKVFKTSVLKGSTITHRVNKPTKEKDNGSEKLLGGGGWGGGGGGAGEIIAGEAVKRGTGKWIEGVS